MRNSSAGSLFAGEYPCDKHGQPLRKIEHGNPNMKIGDVLPSRQGTKKFAAAASLRRSETSWRGALLKNTGSDHPSGPTLHFNFVGVSDRVAALGALAPAG
jgi:hypothetical protein